MKTDPVTAVLLEAEKSLATIASEVVKAGNYDRATAVLGIASQIAVIARGFDADPRATSIVSVRPEKSPENLDEVLAQTRKRKIGKRSAYPKFYRDGNALLKVGFSKKSGEYEHKAPSRVLFALAETVARAGAKGGRFTMDEVLPLVSADLGGNVPVYQPYVCLSWLRDLGFVVQHGRQGYSAKLPPQIPSQVREHWEQLPSRPNSQD